VRPALLARPGRFITLLDPDFRGDPAANASPAERSRVDSPPRPVPVNIPADGYRKVHPSKFEAWEIWH
jgi:hypothetical protein